ncbi:MAG: twin-arginine translocation signal domain-containing protein, partial [Bifidobacteriaceae bacterium]|nr:twin-arginine translocation signal domain-containing protein [Bifidobacteriaceae bacterium]
MPHPEGASNAVSRRAFLGGTAVVGGTAALVGLAACSPTEPEDGGESSSPGQ